MNDDKSRRDLKVYFWNRRDAQIPFTYYEIPARGSGYKRVGLLKEVDPLDGTTRYFVNGLEITEADFRSRTE
jgi:hypothetical protein